MLLIHMAKKEIGSKKNYLENRIKNLIYGHLIWGLTYKLAIY